MYASCCSLTSIAPLLTKEDMSAAAADTVWIHILELKAPFLSIRWPAAGSGWPGRHQDDSDLDNQATADNDDPPLRLRPDFGCREAPQGLIS